jgi:serine O-acetyltransferase
MIDSKAALNEYLRADIASHRPRIDRWRFWYPLKYPVLAWQRRLRRVEYLRNCKTGLLWKPYIAWVNYRFIMHSVRLGVSIAPNVFGPGLALAHWGNVMVNSKARIGANCRIHPGTCIGANAGSAPVLGDNCYVGPGAKIYGGIRLGDNVRVGANAVVNRSFPNDSLLVGVPAKQVDPAKASPNPWVTSPSPQISSDAASYIESLAQLPVTNQSAMTPDPQGVEMQLASGGA